jgi:ATP-dependent DNA ligase
LVICGELYFGKDMYDFLRNRDNDDLKFAIFDVWAFQKVGNGYYPKERKPYQERRAYLEALFKDRTFEHIHLSECELVKDRKALQQAKERAIQSGYEGIIAKSPFSLWTDGDTRFWTKLKSVNTADLVILGYSRKAKELSALLGYKEGDKWVALCNCGSGFTHTEKLKIKAMLEILRLPNDKQRDKYNILVEPKYVVEVEYQAVITNNGRTTLRHPIFKRLREDKTPEEVSFDKWDTDDMI